VPVALARYIAPALPIVAVTLSPVPEEWAEMPTPKIQGPNPFTSTLIQQASRTRYGQALETFFRAMDVSNCMLAEFRLQSDHPDVVIRPDLQSFDMLDAVKSEEMIALGERAAEAAIPAIREALSVRNSLGRLFRRASPPGILITEEGF
jgi:NTE family protein